MLTVKGGTGWNKRGDRLEQSLSRAASGYLINGIPLKSTCGKKRLRIQESKHFTALLKTRRYQYRSRKNLEEDARFASHKPKSPPPTIVLNMAGDDTAAKPDAAAGHQPSAEELLQAIKDIKTQFPDYGIKRVWTYLKEEKSWQVSEKRVKSTMQENGLTEGGGPAAADGAVEGGEVITASYACVRRRRGQEEERKGEEGHDSEGADVARYLFSAPEIRCPVLTKHVTLPEPTVPIMEIYPNGDYPTGEICEYQGLNAFRTTDAEKKELEKLESTMLASLPASLPPWLCPWLDLLETSHALPSHSSTSKHNLSTIRAGNASSCVCV
eukprot:2921368-Rhodomonas_salina.2